MFQSCVVGLPLITRAFLFGLANTLGVFFLYASRTDSTCICFTSGLLLILLNSWLYMLYCYRHGHELLDREKCVLGILFIEVLAICNIISGNRLIAFETVPELTPTNLLFQLAVAPLVSCLVTILLCKQEFLIKEND